MKKFLAWLTPARRLAVYQIATIVGGILSARGVAQADTVADVLEALGIALGVVGIPALAAANTPKER